MACLAGAGVAKPGMEALNLNLVVGRGEVCGFWGAWQGATTRNGATAQILCSLSTIFFDFSIFCIMQEVHRIENY